jgi:hypothetical protein
MCSDRIRLASELHCMDADSSLRVAKKVQVRETLGAYVVSTGRAIWVFTQQEKFTEGFRLSRESCSCLDGPRFTGRQRKFK